MRKVKYPEMGKRIRQARIDAGLKQKDCLKGLGDVTAQMLSDWENGYVCPTITYLRNIANFYKVSLDYIVLGKKKDENDKKIRTYKDAIEYIISLLNCGKFNITEFINGHHVFETRVFTTDYEIYKFSEEYIKLSNAKELMKKELYDEALKDLVNKYDKILK